MDLARARELMVETQVRTNDVTDPRVLRAMRALPRERFVPAARRALAYADIEPELTAGRTLMRPRDVAKLIQALAPAPHERAIEIVGATGYGAAVLASCCAFVVAHDPDPDLSFAARAALESAGVANFKTVTTPAVEAWVEDGPYDVMLLNGSAEFVPATWLSQLAPGGRLGVVVRSGACGAARIYMRSGATVAHRVAFDAAPPLAPGLAQAKTFQF
jgi:protein-L-isoaspartate(D-aspartate) O-methyltransferase